MIDRHRETANPSLERLPRSSGRNILLKKGLEITPNPFFSFKQIQLLELFPFNRGRRFAANVVANTIDSSNLIDNAVGNLAQ